MIAAGDDPATPPEHGAAIAEGTGAELLVLDHAAHIASAEQPAAFGGAMLRHLQAVRA